MRPRRAASRSAAGSTRRRSPRRWPRSAASPRSPSRWASTDARCPRDGGVARGGERRGIHRRGRGDLRRPGRRCCPAPRRRGSPRSASSPASTSPDGVAGDLGGGSLELVDVNGREDRRPARACRSAACGCEAASDGSLKEAREDRRRGARPARRCWPRAAKRAFYAIGGTWRSLARLHMHRQRLSAARHARIRDRPRRGGGFLPHGARGATSTRSTRSRSCRSSAGRCCPTARWCCEQVIKAMRPSTIVISALGLREGPALRAARRQGEGARPADRRVRGTGLSPLALAARMARSSIPWSETAIAALGLEETTEEERLRARRLPARRYRLARASGLSRRAEPEHHRQRRLRRHRPSRPRLSGARQLLPARRADRRGARRRASASSRRLRYRERARALGARFRVAYLVSGAMPRRRLPRTRIEARGKALTLVLPADLADLRGARLDSRLAPVRGARRPRARRSWSRSSYSAASRDARRGRPRRRLAATCESASSPRFSASACLAEELAPPAVQGRHVGLVVGGDRFQVVDAGDDARGDAVLLATIFSSTFRSSTAAPLPFMRRRGAAARCGSCSFGMSSAFDRGEDVRGRARALEAARDGAKLAERLGVVGCCAAIS